MRQKLIGLGERSLRKSYYAQLQSRLVELERFRALLDHSNNAILLIKASDLRVADANHTAGTMLARSTGELKGTPLPDLVEYEASSPLGGLLRGGTGPGPLVAEGRCFFISQARARLPIEYNAREVAFAGQAYLVFVGWDISDRLKAEEALRESEERLRLLASNLPNALVYQLATYPDSQRRFLYVSGNIERLLEVSEEAVLADASVIYNQVLPQFRPAMQAMEERALRQLSPFNLEVPCRLSSGRLAWFHISSTPRTLAGQTVLWDGVAMDITQRKQAEEEKERVERQLRQAQKMEAVGTLAGGIAHDFNNILSVIMGYSEMALEMSPPGDGARRAMIQVLGAAQRAGKLVKKIMTFSRKGESDKHPIVLNQCVGHIQEILEHTLPRMIAIETHLAPDLGYVLADANQMEQVLLNLATNAADAMPDGGSLVFETQNVALTNDFCHQHLEVRPGSYVLLTVSDTGLGMDEATREKIFDPFYTTKGVGKGTGLGLSTVYGIVADHEGYIYCYSEPDAGTVFKIYLPVLKESASAERQTPLSPEAPLGGAECVLLVDDEEALRDLGAHTLRAQGYQVRTARNGEEALEIYRANPGAIDLVIMDLSMPGMGGRNCLKKILALNPQAKVVVISGYSARSQVKSALEAGAQGYLAKPFLRADLLGAVRKALDQ
ncbi:MAG: response regulator [Desulfarculus sp.]|nr:response regulator [Desulfarculus sp.]